ncbi:unnamed protein product [Meloidogyne enterolobii]|uniref:Uncharacterized protein n=1 Tax=Meloidogyne enterolobii TaxID=390850 RepID=A0ACB0YI47_MELEN
MNPEKIQTPTLLILKQNPLNHTVHLSSDQLSYFRIVFLGHFVPINLFRPEFENIPIWPFSTQRPNLRQASMQKNL